MPATSPDPVVLRDLVLTDRLLTEMLDLTSRLDLNEFND